MRGGLRDRVVCAALVMAATIVLGATPANAAEPTKKSLTFDVTVGPANNQKCTIVADLYTPPGASKANPVPAVMGTNGFGGSKDDFAAQGTAYAKRGFAFLAYSGLGFGNSGCKITLDDPDYDGKAGSQLLSFLGGTKAAKDGTTIDYIAKDGPGDPRVGMIGGSYGGQIQFAVAGVDRRLDTIVPIITWNDLSYSLAPNNTDINGVTYSTPGVVKADWPVLFSALGLGQGFQQAVQNQDPSHLGACPNFADQVCPGLITGAAQGYLDAPTQALLRHASVSSYMSKIRIPTFLVQGQSDTLFNLQEAATTYKSLRAQGTPVKMLWRSAGHSGGSIKGENDTSSPESAYESRMELQWLQYYLQGVGPKPARDFSFLRDWVGYSGDAAPSVGVVPSYPAGPDQTMFLSGTNALVPSRGSVQRGTSSFLAAPGAAGTGGSFTELPVQVPDNPATSAGYQTAPLTQDTDVVGVPRLTVKIDAPTFAATQSADPGTKLVVFAKLLDLDASGNATLPRDQLSAVRVGDVNKPVEIQLPGIVHRFPKGHRIRLIVGTANATNRNSNAAGPISITTDQVAPATLTLPRPDPSSISTLGGQAAGTSGRCLSKRSPIGPKNIGRVRLGYTRKRLLSRLPIAPERRTARAYRYCVAGRSGVVKAVFSRRSSKGRSALAVTTARGHGNRNVTVHATAKRFRRAYPHRRKIGAGLYRATRRSPRVFGIRKGRVVFIAVASKGVLHSRRTLRAYLKLAGVKPR